MELETQESQEGAYQRFEKIYDYNSLQQAYKPKVQVIKMSQEEES